MIIVKVLENKNKLLKILSMGLENAFVCNLIVDKQNVATLRPGEETTIELSQGSHKVFFKDTGWGGIKSNKLVVNINPERDYTFQAQRGINGGFVASYTSSMPSASDSGSIKCPNCEAFNKNRFASECEYCGSPLK